MRDATTPPSPSETPRPANRAERRAAARGRSADGGSGGSARTAPRSTGPREHTKPAHARADFAARRSG